jgi:hypothetical protein
MINISGHREVEAKKPKWLSSGNIAALIALAVILLSSLLF